ncbi:MAG TPA: PEGA domain-containing protein [Rectinemataceae bacterium]|nr:PEGA domain-containing protein [Rectinemataceae bacterium]
MRSKHRYSILPALVVFCLAGLSERTFAEEAIVVNTRDLAIGSQATLLVRAFADSREFSGSTGSASVYLDRRLAGAAPYGLAPIAAGTWLLGVSAPGYEPRELQLEIVAGKAYEVIFRLERARGRLSLAVDPPEAEIFVDGKRSHAGLLELPSGFRDVTARRFGFETRSATIFVPTRGVASLSLFLKPAIFTVSNFAAAHHVFNPANAGPIGEDILGFKVSGPGSGRLLIVDETGATVFERDFAAFTTWEQSLGWNGRDGSGSVLPDGDYTARLETTSPSGLAKSMDLDIVIDSSIVARPFGPTGGLPGLIYFPIPLSAPKGLGGFDFAATNDLSTLSGFSPELSAETWVSVGSIDLGLGAYGDFAGMGRLALGLAVPLPPALGFGPGFGLDFGLASGSDGLVAGRASLSLPLVSGLGEDLRSGTPALFLGLAPGAAIEGNLAATGTILRLEAGGGLAFAGDAWVLGLSTRARSGDLLASAFSFASLEAAIEGRFLIPSSPFVLTAAVGDSLAGDLRMGSPWARLGLGLWLY